MAPTSARTYRSLRRRGRLAEHRRCARPGAPSRNHARTIPRLGGRSSSDTAEPWTSSSAGSELANGDVVFIGHSIASLVQRLCASGVAADLSEAGDLTHRLERLVRVLAAGAVVVAAAVPGADRRRGGRLGRLHACGDRIPGIGRPPRCARPPRHRPRTRSRHAVSVGLHRKLDVVQRAETTTYRSLAPHPPWVPPAPPTA
jgi:hypothetical protein